jgi:hypothetical protein
MNEKFKYSIHVYEDFAIIRGKLKSDVFQIAIRLCEKEGFTYIVPNYDGKGFKLIRKE